MKFWKLLAIIITISILITPVPAFSAPPAGMPVYSAIFIVDRDRYFVNNELPGYKMDVVPIFEQGRVFVPARFLGRALGVPDHQITWDGSKRQFTLVKGTNSIILTVGKKEIIVNGQPQTVDVAPLNRFGRVLLPARFVAEALGYQVAWDDQNQAVIVLPVGGHRPEISGLFTARMPVTVSREINIAEKKLLVTHGAQTPVWSPDSRKIAFVTAAIAENMIANSDIWVVDSYGGNLKQLARHQAVNLHPTWSADGSKVAFASDRAGGSDIWVVNSINGDLRPLTRQVAHNLYPVWSADGKKIVFISLRRDGYCDIWVMNSNGGNLRLLAASKTDDAKNFLQPVWSPNSRKIAFISQEPDNPNSDIWVINIDGSNLKQLTMHTKYDGQPAWSPDGSKIAFMSERAGNADIWLMDNNGDNLRQLTTDVARDTELTWSPDGSKIAFVSDRAGNSDIWVMNSDGGNLKQLTTEEANESQPNWSADGQKISFLSERDGKYDLWVLVLK